MVQRGDDLPRLEWPDVFHSPHHVPLAFQRRRGKVRQMARDVDGTGLLARADRCCFDKEPRFGNCIRAHNRLVLTLHSTHCCSFLGKQIM